jgi:hypothetical protein
VYCFGFGFVFLCLAVVLPVSIIGDLFRMDVFGTPACISMFIAMGLFTTLTEEQ